MDNLRGLLGIKSVYKVPNARIRQLCGVTKGVDQNTDEGVLRWFVRGECMGRCLGYESFTLTRFHSYELQQLF